MGFKIREVIHESRTDHRIWAESIAIGGKIVRGSKRWIIGDQSARQPENTDDGVLYVDTDSKPEYSTDRNNWRLPLARPDGEKTATIASTMTIVRLIAAGAFPERVILDIRD